MQSCNLDWKNPTSVELLAFVRLGAVAQIRVIFLGFGRFGLGGGSLLRAGARAGGLFGLGRAAGRLRPGHRSLGSLGLFGLGARAGGFEPLQRQLLVVVELILLLLVLLEQGGLLVLLQHLLVLSLGGCGLVLVRLLFRRGELGPHFAHLAHGLFVGHAVGHEFFTLVLHKQEVGRQWPLGSVDVLLELGVLHGVELVLFPLLQEVRVVLGGLVLRHFLVPLRLLGLVLLLERRLLAVAHRTPHFAELGGNVADGVPLRQ